MTEREDEEHDEPRADPAHRLAETRSMVQEPLDPHRPERRHDQEREVTQAARVVQVDVAERQRERERAEPARTDEDGVRQQVRQHRHRTERDDEVPSRRIAQRERHEQQHGRARGSRRASRRARAARPPTCRSTAIGMSSARRLRTRDRPHDRAVPVGQARPREDREVRDHDREVRERQEHEERDRPPDGGAGVERPRARPRGSRARSRTRRPGPSPSPGRGDRCAVAT